MEPEQREALLRNRVELVENINIQDGLYTQLLSRNVFNSRTISRIKLNRTSEEQVEELLNELPKKECFNALIEALKADGQEHIVKKFLTLPDPKSITTSTTTTPTLSTAATTSGTSERTSSQPAETTDSSSLKRGVPANSTSAVICIRETDNQHLYIRYNDEASPVKSQRYSENENSLLSFEPDETRHIKKHYLLDPSSLQTTAKRPAVLQERCTVSGLDNPQSVLQSPHASNQSHYTAAIVQQVIRPDISASVSGTFGNGSDQVIPPSVYSPVKESSSKIDKNGDDDTAQIRQLLRPNSFNTESFSPNVTHLQTNSNGRFIRLAPSTTQASGYQFTDPQKYLKERGLLTPTKGFPTVTSTSPPVRDTGFLNKASLHSDSVDTMTVKGSVYESPWKGSLSNIVHAADILASPISGSVGPAQGGFLSLSSKMPPVSPYQPSIKDICVLPGIKDMDDIDLPDGCVNVKVEHSTKEFFMANYKRAYPMRSIPRGVALIINVDEVEGKPARKGTNFDRDNLCKLLCQLHFHTIVYNDKDGLSAQEMVIKLREFAKMSEHQKYDACFICLLSHGEEEYIFGTDGKRIPLNEIFMLFDNTNCKGLRGKPKIFIIQACRGGTLDKGVRMDETDGGSIPAKSHHQLPTMSDMLICFPTQMGYYAWRNRARGSWYIEAIVQIFMRYAKNEDVCAMLNRVNHLVSKKVSECNQKEMNQMSQMSEYTSTLREPYLFLFPGIGCAMNSE